MQGDPKSKGTHPASYVFAVVVVLCLVVEATSGFAALSGFMLLIMGVFGCVVVGALVVNTVRGAHFGLRDQEDPSLHTPASTAPGQKTWRRGSMQAAVAMGVGIRVPWLNWVMGVLILMFILGIIGVFMLSGNPKASRIAVAISMVGLFGSLLVAGVAALVVGFVRARRIEDAATAKAATAAQGYTELQGTAQPFDALLTCPVCNGKTLFYQGSSNKQVYRSDEPFLLVDSSGFCVVDPAGADVTLPRSASSHCMHINVGTPVYVIGELEAVDTGPVMSPDQRQARDAARAKLQQALSNPKILAAFDRNRDGVVDTAERGAAVRVLTGLHEVKEPSRWAHVIREPEVHGRPFMISTLPQDKLASQMRAGSVTALGWLVGVSLAAWWVMTTVFK